MAYIIIDKLHFKIMLQVPWRTVSSLVECSLWILAAGNRMPMHLVSYGIYFSQFHFQLATPTITMHDFIHVQLKHSSKDKMPKEKSKPQKLLTKHNDTMKSIGRLNATHHKRYEMAWHSFQLAVSRIQLCQLLIYRFERIAK